MRHIQDLKHRAQFRIVLCLLASALLAMASLGLAVLAGAWWLLLFVIGEVSITMIAISEIDDLL